MIRLLALVLTCASALAAQSTDLASGVAHFNARRWSDAHAFFSAAVKAQPRNADAALWYGRTLLAEDKIPDAERWFTKAADLDPRRADAHLWMARALGIQAQRASMLKQPFLARKVKAAVDRAIEIDPENLDARELRWQFYAMAPAVMGGGEDKARAEAAEITRRNKYRGQLLSAGAAGRSKDFATAERLLKSLIAEYPDSVAPVGAYAVWLADRTRPAEAFAVVDAFQKRRPSDPVALFQIGRVAAATGQQLDRGEEALRKYLTLAPPPAPNVPTLSTTHVRLGNIAERRGNTAAARAAYEQALALDPRNGQARRALAALK
ncbi:MAG: tetratricopeptide repeat protein [Gemmatimonadota bacterium]|nr:tetratricopeptide repeat protein [Gemmatimonadota bacterium]